MSKVSFREQVVERGPKRHGMDDKLTVAGESEDDHFEELAIAARTNHQDLRRVRIGVHVHDDQRMLNGIDHLVAINAMSTR
jgi:hypothetical protein